MRLRKWLIAGFSLCIFILASCGSDSVISQPEPTATFGFVEPTARPTATIPAGTALTLQILTEPDTLCADGTNAAYYLRLSPSGTPDWLIHLPGGGYCSSAEDCAARSRSNNVQSVRGMTSLGLPPELAGEGLLSADAVVNPNFHDYNVAALHYCTADGWVGARGAEAATGDFHLQGRAIFTTVVEALTAQGMGNGNIVLLGSESGSIGVVAYLDSLANQFPGAQLYGISEGGWTDYELDTLENSPGLLAQNQALLAFVGAELDESCALAESELAHCLPNPRVVPYLDNPIFVVRDQFDPEIGLRGGESEAEIIRASVLDAPAGFSTRLGLHTGLTDEFILSALIVDDVSVTQALTLWLDNTDGTSHWIAQP